MADAALAYETIEPSRIALGGWAIIKVTSLDGYLKTIPLPTVPGLTFEILGRSQGLEFVSGKSIPATYIVIRVKPQFLGVFTIPGLTPKSPTLGLEVVNGDEPDPYALRSPNKFPAPLPVSPARIPERHSAHSRRRGIRPTGHSVTRRVRGRKRADQYPSGCTPRGSSRR